MGDLPAVAEQLLANIPRLEPVREILRYQHKRYDGQGPPPGGTCGDAIPWGARALKAATDLDALESQGCARGAALETMRLRAGWYDPALLEAFARLKGSDPDDTAVLTLPLHAVEPGMVFAEDVKTPAGLLLIARGQEVTLSLVARIKNLALASKITDLVQVTVPRAPLVSPPPS